MGPKVGTGPNSIKTVLTLALRESHISNFGPNYAGTGPNFGPKCFVKDTQISESEGDVRVWEGSPYTLSHTPPVIASHVTPTDQSKRRILVT